MNKIVVSLTTYNKRIHSINKVIESLNKQSVKPDVIVLYLYSKEFESIDLNINKQDNLVVKFVDENLKGHKKYFYAFQEYKDDIVITLDDDVYYHKDTIKKLLEFHKKYPKCVVANRTRFITMRDCEIEDYYRWEKNFPENYPSMLLIGTGVLGILYPPHTFNEQIFDKENLIKYALDNDDMWLKIHQIRNGVKTVLTDLDKSLNLIEDTQETALCQENYVNDGCNKAINELTNLYSIDLKKIFLSEFKNDNFQVIYKGLYSTCFKNNEFVIKTLNFENSPESEYEISYTTHNANVSKRRVFGFSKSPSIIVYDYLDGEILNKTNLNISHFNSICEYIKKLQQISTKKFKPWNKYRDDCIQVLSNYIPNSNKEIEMLKTSKCECVIHGDINPNNVLCNNNEVFIIDYENSSIGPSWWDKNYLLANYNPNEIDAEILNSLTKEDIENILLITKVRIGRLIRKNMDTQKMLNSLRGWESVYITKEKGDD